MALDDLGFTLKEPKGRNGRLLVVVDGKAFPSLLVAPYWVEHHCIVPDGFRRGEQFDLVKWQATAYLNHYRLKPTARLGQLGPAFHNSKSMVVLPQKAGKAPFSASRICLEGVGPALFAGWAKGGEIYDCRDHGCGCGWAYEYQPGEAMGQRWPTPLIQITATSEDQPLALDTPIATPTGWTTVGDLAVGDSVFGADGVPVPVARTTPVFVGECCYEVTFSDGECITASAAHGWTVDCRTGHGDKREVRTVTTEGLAGLLARNPRVGATALDLPTVDLGIDPYLLGLWLGDGSTADAQIAIDTRDRDELEGLLTSRLEWFEEAVWSAGPGHQGAVRIKKRDKICPYGHDWSNDAVDQGTSGYQHCGQCRRERRAAGRVAGKRLYTFRERLRQVGVLGDKHIPDAYLRSGTDQRRELLRGLIDSDGGIEPNGRACFTNTNERLARDVEKLLVSLGYPCRVHRDEYAWRAKFTPGTEYRVALLDRKSANQKPLTNRSRYACWRYVTSVEPCASVPVRCIGLDTGDHLFLAGERCVPTHNTGNIYTALRPMIDDGPLSVLIPHTGENFIRLPNNGRIDPVTSNGRSRLGQRVTDVEWDEPGLYLRSNKMYGFSEAVYDTQDRGVTAMGGRGTLTTNAWDPSQDSAAKQVAKEAGENDDVYVLHPMAPSGLRYRVRAERHKIHKHVYRDCPWIDLDAIEGLAAKLAKRDPGQAERFYGNNPVAGQGVAFDVEQIKKLTAPRQVKPFATVVLGADGARFRDAMVVRACEIKTGYRWTVGVWERPKDAPEDYEHPRDLIDGAVREVFENFNVWRMLVDPQYIDYLLAGWQHDYGDRRVMPWYTNRPKQMCWAVRHHAQEIASSLKVLEETGKPGGYSHDGNPQVMTHFANARKRPETIQDDEGAFMHTLSKEHAHSELFIDGTIADVLVNQARAMCIAAGAGDDHEPPPAEPQKSQVWTPGSRAPGMGAFVGQPSQAGPMGSMS